MKSILGISAFYHDSAATIIIDGKIIAAAQEERFTRIKHDKSYPFHAIEFVLKYSKLKLSEIDHIVFFEKPFLKFERLLETYVAFAPRGFKSFCKAMPIWLNEKLFQKDIAKKLNRNVFCENDANCFTLSESIDGSAKHYNIVFGVILGSGCGGGLVVNKKIVKGANNLAGEWGHNHLPRVDINNLKRKTNMRDSQIESFISGLSLSKIFKEKHHKDLKAYEIFELYRKKDIEAEKIIDEYKENLSISLCSLINIIDPDAIVFGGGVSNEISFLDEVKKKIEKFLKVGKLNTALIKPMYGDASGVRGAARLGRKINY